MERPPERGGDQICLGDDLRKARSRRDQMVYAHWGVLTQPLRHGVTKGTLDKQIDSSQLFRQMAKGRG